MLPCLYSGILEWVGILCVKMVIKRTGASVIPNCSLDYHVISSTKKPESEAYGKLFVFSVNRAVWESEKVCSDGKQIQMP